MMAEMAGRSPDMSNSSRIHAFHPERYGDVKSAVRALLHAVGGEAKAAAACRVSKSTLSEYGNPRYDERHMPLDVVLALEKVAGEMPVTEHLAAEHDALLLHLPSVEAVGGWMDHLTTIGKEAGDVFHRAGEYLADDGEIDAVEAPGLLKEVDELLAAVAAMRAAVQARIPDEDEA